MTKIVNDYPAIRLSSLPRMGKKPCIELSLRGSLTDVETAMNELITAIDVLQIDWTHHAI